MKFNFNFETHLENCETHFGLLLRPNHQSRAWSNRKTIIKQKELKWIFLALRN